MSQESLFGAPMAARVGFIVDASSSMRHQLPTIRRHLKSTLAGLVGLPGARFNIVTFGGAGDVDELSQWSERLTVATREMVDIADEWIDAIRAPKAASDEDEFQRESMDGDAFLEAIQSLSEDPGVQAVHVVSGTSPEGDHDSLLDRLVEVADGVAVHCVYLCESRPRRRVFDFFHFLAEETGGSVRAFVCDGEATLCPVAVSGGGLVWRQGQRTERLEETHCSVTTALTAADPVDEWRNAFRYAPAWWPYSGLSFFRPTPEVMAIGDKFRRDRLLMSHNSEEAGDVLVGRHVLGRRAKAGVFYRGVVQKKVSLHEFLVTFSSPEPTSAKDFETVYITDLIDIDDAMRSSISPSDCVLAPRGLSESSGYEPAVVVSGFEKRGAYSPSADSPLVVKFSDGEIAGMEAQRAVWIPYGLHSRFVLELEMSAEARAKRRETDSCSETVYDPVSKMRTDQPCPWFTCVFPPRPIGPIWNPHFLPQRLPTQPIDLRSCSQPIYAAVGPTTALQDVRVSVSQSATSIEKAAAESTVQIVECVEEEKKEERLVKKEENVEEAGKEEEALKRLEEEPHPFVEEGPLIDGFKDKGHPVALSRPPLRKIHRKPPWRYWAHEKIPNIDDGPTFDPYKDPENMWGKPFAMTADLNPAEIIKEDTTLLTIPSRPPQPPHRGTPWSLTGRVARDMSRDNRLKAVLHRADVAAAIRDDSGLPRVRADRRERLLRRQFEDIKAWAHERRAQSPDLEKEKWSHDSWDWLDRKLIPEERHSEMARSQFRRKQMLSRP